MTKPPLILTLAIDKEGFLFFNNLRKHHFPASRNFIDAHLTLFHALPNNESILETVRVLCFSQSSFTMLVKDPVSIGNGVAFKIDSKEILNLHNVLKNTWKDYLSQQDRQKPWPHITVQNKVSAEDAKQLLEELKNDFTSFSIIARGLQVWEYLGGSWRLIEECVFQDSS